MKRAAPISLLLTILFLLPTIVTVLPTSASTQSFQSIEINSWGPTTAVVGQTTTLYVRVYVGGKPAPATTTVDFLLDGSPVVYRSDGSQIGPVTTDNTGLAQVNPWSFGKAGTFTFTARVFSRIYGLSTEKTWSVSVSSAGTPTPQQPSPATPVPATPSPATPSPATPASPPIVIYVPPPTVITQTFPGTVTQGTGPWGNPRVTVTNPGPDNLRTTLIDFANNPEDTMARYIQQVGAAKSGGWTLTAQGEKTYGDHSKDTRYSRFVKGTSTLNFAAQGNNSTNKQYNIPGDVLITDQNETFSSGTAGFSLFGLEGLAAYAVAAVIVIVIAALIVVAALYYDNRRRNRGADQQQHYPRR